MIENGSPTFNLLLDMAMAGSFEFLKDNCVAVTM